MTFSIPAGTQETGVKPEKPGEMQVIDGGFLAIDTPKGWVRSEGPGLLFFLKESAERDSADVWIYVSGDSIGPDASARNLKDYIQSDIAGYRARFKNGLVREEAPMELPRVKLTAPVVTFESQEKHNSFEQVVYAGEQTRILTFVLSAKTEERFVETLPAFQEFAKSYGGSITLSPDTK